jgi:hypothetical protein
MKRKTLLFVLILTLALILGMSQVVAGQAPVREPSKSLLASGLEGGAGSAIGPDGALYVTERVPGRISRVDPQTGDVTTFANGLPAAVLPLGGVMDVAFVDDTAYALVTLVGTDVGGNSDVGIYRIDGPTSNTLIADIGAWSIANPPNTSFAVPTGVQYAMDNYRGGFLVTDGHHNRVLRIKLSGAISEMMTFGNTVPTGLAVHGKTVYMGEAGAVPHLPEDGRVVSFTPQSSGATVIASGAPLLVDVEFGLGRTLYALSQGEWDGVAEGSPAFPDTGALMEVQSDGTVVSVMDNLDRPTSVDFIGGTAYVVTLDGEVWMIENASNPPYGLSR